MALLACDWGTTNLRAWVIDDSGTILRHRSFAFGVSRLSPGDAPRVLREEVREALAASALPAMLCGMVGSELGWKDVPHRPCPASLGEHIRTLELVERNPAPVWIVPGLKCAGIAGAPDVIRGEETQIFGWIASDPMRSHGRHAICHPGTHAKWVLIVEGAIERFVTAMTGELFDLLRRHSVLRSNAALDDAAAFDEGVAAAGDGGALAARLFTVRSRIVAGRAAPASSASYLSGLLTGAEIAAVPSLLGVEKMQSISLIGDASLCRWYARALAQLGWTAETHSGEDAAIAGLRSFYRLRP